MSWNVRQIYHDTAKSPYIALHKVYYHKNGAIKAWTEAPIQMVHDDFEGLKWYLVACNQALKEPVLRLSELHATLQKEAQ